MDAIKRHDKVMRDCKLCRDVVRIWSSPEFSRFKIFVSRNRREEMAYRRPRGDVDVDADADVVVGCRGGVHLLSRRIDSRVSSRESRVQ